MRAARPLALALAALLLATPFGCRRPEPPDVAIRALEGQYQRVRDYALTAWFLRDVSEGAEGLPEVLSEARDAVLTRPASRLVMDWPDTRAGASWILGVRRRGGDAEEDAQAAAVVCEVFLRAGGERTALGSRRLPPPHADDPRWSSLEIEVPPGSQRELELVTRWAAGGSAAAPEVLWSLPRPARGAPQAHPDVLLLTIDTFRADALESAPALARRLAQGTLWPAAVSPSNWTLPAYGSLFTGLEPGEHGAGRGPFTARASRKPEERGFRGLDPERATLAASFARAGYATAMFHQNPFLEVWTGMDRGFQRYVRTRDETRVALELAERWWRHGAGRPRFLVVHLMAPHYPYEPPAEQLDAPLPPDPLATRDLRGFLGTDQPPRARRRFFDLSPEDRRSVVERYRAEVRALDRQLDPWLDRMLGDAPGDRTPILAFHSDHGEELWDEGSFEHGHSFSDAVIRVPVGIVWPGRVPARRIERPVPAHGLAATLLRLAELPALPDEPDRDLFSWDRGARSQHPLYRSASGGVVLPDDPDAAPQPLAFPGDSDATAGEPAGLPPELRRALAELGYVADPVEEDE